MKVLTFLMCVELGIIPIGNLKFYEIEREIEQPTFYGDFELDIFLLKHFFVGIGSKISIWKDKKGYNFTPDNVLFVFRTGVYFNKNIEFGFRHYCQHPIKAWDLDCNANTLIEQGYEEIYIKLDFMIGEKID